MPVYSFKNKKTNEVYDLTLSYDEMLKYKNFGRKSLTELGEKLDQLNLKFGMDISNYIEE